MHLHETSDTLFDGPRIVIRTDSLALNDTMSVAVDSLVKDRPLIKEGNVLERRLFSTTLDSLKRK